MPDIGEFIKAAQQFAQNYDIDKVIQKEELADLKALLAQRLDIKADAKESLQKGQGILVQREAKSKLKKKGKALANRVQKAAPAEKAKEVAEVTPEEREAKPLEEVLTELRQTVLPSDAKLNRYENARILLEMAENKEVTADQLVAYLIHDQGPYARNPDKAEDCLKLAINELKDQSKKLKLKYGEDSEDYQMAQTKLDKLNKSYQNYLNSVEIELSGPYTGVPMGRVVKIKEARREKINQLIPRLQNENEFQETINKLRSLSDRIEHSQYCSQFDYQQILSLFAIIERETSELLNSKGIDIERGQLIDTMNSVKNNRSYKFIVRAVQQAMIAWMKEWYHKMGAEGE